MILEDRQSFASHTHKKNVPGSHAREAIRRKESGEEASRNSIFYAAALAPVLPKRALAHRLFLPAVNVLSGLLAVNFHSLA